MRVSPMVKESKPAKTPSGRERRIPRLREQCQIGYEILCPLLQRAGHGAVIEPIKGLDNVDDVLRRHPEVVATLLTAAWELRGEKQFRDLFLHQETGELVSDRTQPIGPCGRTYDEVIMAHLYGSARLYMERQERRWATARARQATAEYQQEEEKKRQSLTGRLLGSIKELASGTPTFTADQFRSEYPGHGLYERIKPLLNSDRQFRLIPLYGQLQTRQVEALGDLLAYFTEPRDLENLIRLNAEDIAQAKGFARIYAEARLGVSRSPNRMAQQRPASKQQRDPAEEAAEQAKLKQLPQEERRIFDLLLTRYLDCFTALKKAGTGAETTIRRLTPVFGEDVFALFRDEKELSNAVNCPDFILRVIGVSARAMTPELAASLTHIQNKDITRDILTLAMETFPRADLERFFTAEDRRAIWFELPAKFNNNYNYQADAPADSGSIRNFDNLRTVCEGLFESLRNGRAEKL